MHIFNFFKPTTITTHELLDSLGAHSPKTESKTVETMQKFLNSKKYISKSEAEKINIALEKVIFTPPETTTTKKIDKIFYFFFPSVAAKGAEVKVKMQTNIQGAIKKETEVEKKFKKIEELDFTDFDEKLKSILQAPSLTPLDIKVLSEMVMRKFSLNDSCTLLKKIFDKIEALDIKKDPENLEILNMLKEFENDADKIFKKSGMDLVKISKNPLSTLYFVKLALNSGMIDNIYTLNNSNKIGMSDSKSIHFKKQIKLFQEIKDLTEKKDNTGLLLQKGKELLTLEEFFPNRIILQEGSRILRNSMCFSQYLFDDINKSISSEPLKPTKILSDIETLLEQNPNTLSDLNLTEIKNFLKNLSPIDLKKLTENLPKVTTFLVETKLQEIIKITDSSSIDIDKTSKLLSDKLKSEDCKELKVIFVKNKEMIFVDINKETNTLNLSYKKFIADGELARVFRFSDTKIIKIPKSATDETVSSLEDTYKISQEIYTKNPEGMLPLEKVSVDDVVEFSGQSEYSSFHKDLGMESGKKISVFSQKCCTPLLDLQKTQIIAFSKNLASVISTSHSLDIVHGDIKPNNIVYDEAKAYLIDWEGALKIKDLKTLPKSFDHTNGYVIEEEDKKCLKIAEKFNNLKKITPNSDELNSLTQEYLKLRKQIDIFELGTTLYQLALKSTEKFPFTLTKPTDKLTVLELKSVDILTPNSFQKIHNELISIYSKKQAICILAMLHPDPEKRPLAERISEVFSDR